MQSSILSILAILSFLAFQTFSHFIPKVKENEETYIKSYVNQAKEIQIPFNKCFQVAAELAANSKLISFQPSSLQLTELMNGEISEDHNRTLLEDLRSPQSYSHEHLIVFDHYAIAFLPPNFALIIKEEQGQFKVTNRIKIEETNLYSQFKVYKFNQKAMMLVNIPQPQTQKQITKAFLISEQNYEEVKINEAGPISHFEANGNEFFTAEYGRGVRCYAYSEEKKTVSEVASFDAESFKHVTENLYLVDINIKSLKSHNIIYVLDAMQGVFRINLTKSQREPEIDLVVSEPNCNALDSISINHLVLVCQLGSSSYIVEAYGAENEKGQTFFNKLQPEYHINFFNDLSINKNYFLVFTHRTLSVYWSSKENNIPETVNTQSQLDLPGLETFFFKMNEGPKGESYIYVIQSGVFKKMLISESPARLTVKSENPLQKIFKLSIFGNCMDLSKEVKESISAGMGISFDIEIVQSLTCEVQKIIKLEVTEEISVRKEDFSVSASIIVILIVIFLLVIWICLKKYKGLEREARKVLEAYKRKRSRL